MKAFEDFSDFIIEACVVILILLASHSLSKIDKKLDRIESEVSALNARMDSLEFFKLPEVKK